MASVKTSLLVTLVVFVQFIELSLGGCVFDPICSKSSDCLNGGTCFQNVCHCTEFYIGDHCDTAFQCKTDAHCLNNGKCTNCSPGFKATCDCAFGYIGANCAFKYSCDKICSTSSHCFNGGTCHDNVCHCPVEFVGDHCETESAIETTTETTLESTTEQMTKPMSPNCTASSDCLNDGTCHTNNCHCTDGHIGDHCETEFQCTKDADCLNDGTCHPDNTKPCDCTLGYVGANCDKWRPLL
ncbi:hypothetical protein LSAT2_014910 [Lamellibrachia satsuma]|nr:hypothetical protein LSAT2_014910 [Lamellibrachia satsuma]